MPTVQKQAHAVLALMQFTLTPDVTTASLSISNGGSGNPGYAVTQLGGGDTISNSTPIYLEGNLAASRYDPVFIVSNGTERRPVPVKWNSVTATGGIGYDFLIAEDLKLRPVFIFSRWAVLRATSSCCRPTSSGRPTGNWTSSMAAAWTPTGSAARSCSTTSHYRPDDYEIDLEARLNSVSLNSLGSTSDGVKANYLANSVNIWARWRAPTGLYALDRPLRYVLETTLSNYLGTQGDRLGFNWLLSLGTGIELDSTKYDMIITRTRLVLRYVTGNNVQGVSVGLAVSF